MATNNTIITVSYSDTGHTRTAPVFQYDYGHKLDMAEFESLPETFEMHFSPVGAKESITMLGGNGMVDIPDTLLRQKQPVFGWLFLHDGETDGETKYIVEIPVIARAAPSDKEYTPEEQDLVTQAVAALQAVAERLDDRVDGLEDTVGELGGTVGELGETVTGLGDTLGELGETVTGLGDTVGELVETVDGINETVGQLGETVNGINETVGQLGETVNGLSENVEGLLDGTKIPVADVQTIIDTYEGS